MIKPKFWDAFWRMALLMLGLFVAVLLLIRGPLVMPLIFSGIPTATLLDYVIYKPLMSWVASTYRLEAAMGLMIVASYLQWTLLGALLSYLWQLFRYRRALSKPVLQQSKD